MVCLFVCFFGVTEMKSVLLSLVVIGGLLFVAMFAVTIAAMFNVFSVQQFNAFFGCFVFAITLLPCFGFAFCK